MYMVPWLFFDAPIHRSQGHDRNQETNNGASWRVGEKIGSETITVFHCAWRNVYFWKQNVLLGKSLEVARGFQIWQTILCILLFFEKKTGGATTKTHHSLFFWVLGDLYRKTAPTLKLKARTWKWIIGRLVSFWGPAYLQSVLINFKECTVSTIILTRGWNLIVSCHIKLTK